MKDHQPFDGDKRPVPTVGFVYPDDEPDLKPSETLEVVLRFEILADLTRYLSAGNWVQAGRRIKYIAFMLRQGPKTQQELARELGITPSRVTQELKEFKRQIAYDRQRKRQL